MTRKIIQASFFWKNDKPGGLGFSFGPPSFKPEELTEMFSGAQLAKYRADSDMALGSGVVNDYFAQLEAIANDKAVSIKHAYLAALNIIWLTERGFLPNDEFNGPQYVWAE